MKRRLGALHDRKARQPGLRHSVHHRAEGSSMYATVADRPWIDSSERSSPPVSSQCLTSARVTTATRRPARSTTG